MLLNLSEAWRSERGEQVHTQQPQPQPKMYGPGRNPRLHTGDMECPECLPEIGRIILFPFVPYPTLKYPSVRVHFPAEEHREMDALVLPLLKFGLAVAGFEFCFRLGMEGSPQNRVFDEMEERVHIPNCPVGKARNEPNQAAKEQNTPEYPANHRFLFLEKPSASR